MQLFGIGQFGKSTNVTAQKRINCYMEVQPRDDRARVAFYGTPGLELFASFGDTPIRGVYSKGDLFYVVHRGTFYSVNNAAVKTALGTIGTTTGKVYMADNGSQLMLTDGTNGYIYTFDTPTLQTISSITNVTTTATLTTALPHGLVSGMEVTITGATAAAYNGIFIVTVTGLDTFTYTMLSDPGGSASVVGTYTVLQFQQITDEDYPGAETVTWLDSYFIVNPPNSQTFYISDINNGLLWDALDFASAESNPDDIVAVWADNGNLYLFGEVSTEFWANTGDLDFPFARISGGATEWGCASRDSIVKYDNSLAFLAQNRMGEVFIARMQGYQPVRISTPELEYIINRYAAVSDAVAYTYMLGGHPMLVMSFPTGNQTWLYDGLSNAWSELQSSDGGRHITELGDTFINKILVTDFENGNLYRLSPDVYTDNGMPINFELISRHVCKDDLRLTIDKLQLDMETGVGLTTGQGSIPQIMMSVSKDGGHTYGTEQWASFGEIGQYKTRALWRRQGQARDWTFKFRISDPVKRVIFDSSIAIRQGTS
jgi:hypothetical protein